MHDSTRRPTRACADCPADISHRPTAKRCEDCARKAKQVSRLKSVRGLRAAALKHGRVCLDCPATLPASSPPNTRRCWSCADAVIRANRQRRRPLIFTDRRKLKPVPPPLADHDMTPARVVTVDGAQFEVVFGGGEGLSSVGSRGSILVEGRGAIRRNGNVVMGGVS